MKSANQCTTSYQALHVYCADHDISLATFDIVSESLSIYFAMDRTPKTLESPIPWIILGPSIIAEARASKDALVTFGAQFMKKLREVGTCMTAVRGETNDIADSTRIDAAEGLSISR